MKKLIVLVMFTVLCAVAFNATAADVLLEAKVTNIITKTDKNGNPYAVLIIEEQRELNGVTYTAEVIATAFRSAYQQASTITPGDTVKMIASKRSYNGDITYTVRALVKKP